VSGRITGRLTNGIRFDFEDASDPAIGALIHLQYVAPALAPILEAALHPGATFYDIGANIGLYSLWASRIVGPEGDVRSFEPVPATAALLQHFASINGLHNITVIPCAVGAERREAWLHFDVGESAQSHIAVTSSSTSLHVSMVRLDDYLDDAPPPTLVKIDVEGYELQVLEGSQSVLKRHRPVIVLEVIASHLRRHSASYPEIYRRLRVLGYVVYDLTPRGLRPSVLDRPTANVLALCPAVMSHNEVEARLSKTCFARNQTV
jgi:FkbM family methyltransferase